MSDGDRNGRQISLGSEELSALTRIRAQATQWCRTHPSLAFGVAEMAMGSALIAWGVHSGVIELGVHLVGTAGDVVSPGGLGGAAAGAAAALVAAKIVGSVGVAAMGTAVCVPAVLIAGGGAILLGGLGYEVGDVSYRLINSFDPTQFLQGGSALLVGLALLLDGGRKVATDDLVAQIRSCVRDRVIELRRTSASVIVTTCEELRQFSGREALTIVGPASMAATGGAAIGTSLAAGSVTVLGSHTLGSVAISLGLVSAPIWPVVAATVAAAGAASLIAFGVVKARRTREARHRNLRRDPF